MSQLSGPAGIPSDAELFEELASQERSERRLLARQVLLVLTLVALLLTHVLLG
jgi:hypothetical protein